MNILSRNILMMLFAALTLIGCGGSDSGVGGSTNVTGKFIDATVVGMGYKCGTSTTLGTTNNAGEFTCPAGQTVAFYVGDILIGSVASATAVVTPLDLVGANAGPDNVTVQNIVRFLMSISSTVPSPTGTLTIDSAVVALAAGKTIDFATATTALDTLITTLRPNATVYTNAQATAHVTASINGLFAGSYSGTYSGTASGNWSMTIAADGAVTGTSDAGAITGSMATTISTGSTYAFTGTASTVPWVGTLNVSTKVFSGTWNDGAGSSGTFTGTASTPAVGVTTCVSSHYSFPVHAPTATELALYAKTYNGSIGNFGPNIGDPFVATGSASFVLSAAGGLTYNGATKLVTSMCLENTPTTGAPLYVEMQPSDHVDFFTDGGFTGILTPNVVRGGSCTTTCGSGGTGGATPTIASFTPAIGAVGAAVTITGTNLTAVTEVLFTGPSPSTAFVNGVIGTKNATSIATTIPASLAAGSYIVSVVHPGGKVSATSVLTVTVAGGGATGLTFSPAFNGVSTFANSAPMVAGSILLYSQNSFQQQFSVTYTPASVSVPEGLTITTTAASGGTAQVAVVNQVTSANNGSPTCTLTAHVLLPTCSNAGIAFNKATGNITFTNTPMAINIGSTAPQPTAFTVNGKLTFPPF